MTQLLILFLIRKRLGLKKGQAFQFANQKSEVDWYYFTSTRLMKCCYCSHYPEPMVRSSNVSLNWLLDDRCKIIKKEV